MTARVIPTRHGIKEPHRIGEGSYLEAYAAAPPLNVLEGHEHGERRVLSSSSTASDGHYDGDAGSLRGPATQFPRGTAPQWPNYHGSREGGGGRGSGIPFDAFPGPPSVPFFMRGGGDVQPRAGREVPEGRIAEGGPLMHHRGGGFDSVPQPIPDLSWSRFDSGSLPPELFPYLPPPPPGFHPSEWRTTAGPSGDRPSDGYSSDAQPWPTPRDVVLPELFPFPPPFLPPPPTFDELRAAAPRHGGDDDFPWLPPAATRHPPEPWGTVHGARREPTEAGPVRQAHTNHVDPAAAATAAVPMRSGSTSADEHERLKSLAEFARRRFLSSSGGGGSRSASNTTERSSSSAAAAAGSGPRDSGALEARHHKHGTATAVRTASASRPAATTYRVQNDYRAGISALMSREEQLRLKQQREERINARRRSCMNTSTTTSVGASTPRYATRKPSTHEDQPPDFRSEVAATTVAPPAASRKAEVGARAATPHASTPSNRRGPGGAAATATASHRSTPRVSENGHRARGITLSALKGETPKLERVMRDGLPSERRRMEEVASRSTLQQQHHLETNHHHASSFIGFGATQYTPFVDLAKRDPRAAEYLRGIEHLYHQLRSSYEEFQKDPAQFLKGPSLNAVRNAVQSPRREADGRAGGGAGVASPTGNAGAPLTAALSSPKTLSGPGGQSPGPGAAPPPLPLSGTTPPRVPQLHVPDMQLAIEPSAETRKLREELDRLEHQWTRLNDVRSAIHETAVAGASPKPQTSASDGIEQLAPASAAAPTPDSVSLRVRSQLLGQAERRDGDVFSYENVLGLVRERRQQQPTS